MCRQVNGGICPSYDDSTNQYIAYLQVMGDRSESGFPQVGSGSIEVETQRRTIAFSHTRDFASWPAPKLILAPDAQDGYDTCFYGANYFLYPGRTDLHCMSVPLFHRHSGGMDVQVSNRPLATFRRPNGRLSARLPTTDGNRPSCS